MMTFPKESIFILPLALCRIKAMKLNDNIYLVITLLGGRITSSWVKVLVLI